MSNSSLSNIPNTSMHSTPSPAVALITSGGQVLSYALLIQLIQSPSKINNDMITQDLVPSIHMSELELEEDFGYGSDSDESESEGEEPPAELGNLSKEVVLQILEILVDVDQCSAVCLGLTCSSFYRLLKTCLPEPINLGQGRFIRGRTSYAGNGTMRPGSYQGCTRLQSVVRRFLGVEKYRFPTGFNTIDQERHMPLLLRTKYGRDRPTRFMIGSKIFDEEKKLEARYSDYGFWRQMRKKWDCRHWPVDLPSPFGMGDGWLFLIRRC
ncbi:hypothetical protein BKA61DRAFT_276570 [Leptodontidium sp. MPI-SDFR-AT-0119]|nr:hypothetical protein BKA61DRAFT_276570 [Leptodontidium sp. MPI-SDFR-AT-0119]